MQRLKVVVVLAPVQQSSSQLPSYIIFKGSTKDRPNTVKHKTRIDA
jgi:hypothetical protein